MNSHRLHGVRSGFSLNELLFYRVHDARRIFPPFRCSRHGGGVAKWAILGNMMQLGLLAQLPIPIQIVELRGIPLYNKISRSVFPNPPL